MKLQKGMILQVNNFGHISAVKKIKILQIIPYDTSSSVKLVSCIFCPDECQGQLKVNIVETGENKTACTRTACTRKVLQRYNPIKNSVRRI